MQKSLPQKVHEYIKEDLRHKRWRCIVTAMACVVVFCTTYALILPAITMTGETYCGKEPHTHTQEECYERVLICGLEETEDTEESTSGHTHTDACYETERILICGEETSAGHSHSDACYDEAGNLACGQEEAQGHSHSEDCYLEQNVLTCGLEETGETETAHQHTDDCYKEQLVCQLEEHEHSLACFSNPEADVETQAVWERTLSDVELTGVWSEDVIAIAESQLGYEESTQNYTVTEDDQKKGYTRYGAWYGDPYGDWCAMFVSFCLHYADVEGYPLDANCQNWIEVLREAPYQSYYACETYDPRPGDLIFFNNDDMEGADHIGIVTENIEATDTEPARIRTIEGNSANRVQYVTYDANDPVILGYGSLPENPAMEQTEDLENQEEIFVLETKTEKGVGITVTGPLSSLPFSASEIRLTANEITGVEETEDAESSRTEIATDTIDAAAKNLLEGAEIIATRLFEVKLWYDDEEIEPCGPVQLIFSGIQEESQENASHYVFYVDENQQDAQSVPSTQRDDGSIVAQTDHFSLYGVVITADTTMLIEGGASGTVGTVDSRSDGITMNLFDYYGRNLDTWDNSVTSPIYNGINAGLSQNHLLFFGSGSNAQNYNPRNSINCYTGGATARQGIVNDTLYGGYPTLRTNGSSLDYLFNTNAINGAKSVYADVNHLFQKDADGYYWYNSDINYAYYNQSTGNFTVYSDTYLNADGTSIGFFPFNDYDTHYTEVKPSDSSHHYNHHFGLTMEADFTIPAGGMVNGKDMIFEFSGDDDVWTFIDGVLVMDIGGIHEAVNGSINFKTGAVTVSSAVGANTSGSTIGTSSSLSEIFAAAGRTYDGSDYSEHTISFFYLERGGCYSNCSLKFNLATYKKRNLEITKKLSGGDVSKVQDRSFAFQLYLESGVGSDSYQAYTGPATYDDGTAVSFDESGIFQLKPGQTVTIPQVMDLKNYYLKEVNLDESLIAQVTVNGEICTPVYSSPEENLYEIQSTTSTVQDRAEVTCDNTVADTPKLSIEKLWQDFDGSPMVPGVEEIQVELWRRYEKQVSPATHTVTFQVLLYDSKKGEIVPHEISRIQIANGGMVSFATALWTGATGAQSTGGSVVQNGTYSFEPWLNATVYMRENIVQDETITILFDVNGAGGWLYPNQIENDSLRFQIISYDSSQPGTGEGECQTTDELVETIVLNAGNNWRYQWMDSALPSQSASEEQYFYYIREIVPEGYEVTYTNNDGISEGTITAVNRNRYTVLLPETGGSGTTLFTLCGLGLMAGVLMYRYFERRERERRAGRL